MSIYPNYTTTPSEEGFLAEIYSSSKSKPTKGVIVIPGSEGGVPSELAKFIASNDYTTMALGYFGAQGLPPALENIPLEYFEHATQWFKEYSALEKVYLLGGSRGGELALLLGTTFPKLFDKIAAIVPSSQVTGGFPHPNKPAWTLKGKPIRPFVRALMDDKLSFTEYDDLLQATKAKEIPFHSNTQEDPFNIVDLFLKRHQQQDVDNSAILVENLKCPLLVIAAGDDQIWPSSWYAQQIAKRLDRSASKIFRKILTYPNAGHGLTAPYDKPIYHPVGHFWCHLGGSPQANQEACEKCWQNIFNFFEQQTQSSSS